MNKMLRNASIRTKLILLSGTAVLLALCMSTSGIIFNDISMIRAETLAQLEVQARMIEFNSDGVLAFSDAEAGNEFLRSMSHQPAVEVACLIDNDAKILSSYKKLPHIEITIPKPLVEGARLMSDGFMEIVMPVREDEGEGETLGTLYIRANTRHVTAHVYSLVEFIVIVSMLSLCVAVTIAAFLQNAISMPILRLAEAAQVITREEDYSIRVKRNSKDELGKLYDAFNQMLDALKWSHDQVANQAKQLTSEVGVRKQAEADLMFAKEAAEASNRAKSEFLANMSHEIRTPLTGILGFTDLLLAGGDEGDDAKRLDYLSTIQSSGKHLLGVINDILDLSKIESGRIQFDQEPCHPEEIVQHVVRVLQVKAEEKGLELKVRWDNAVPLFIHTDASRVRQALINLIGNAIKFTDKGYVELTARLIEHEGRHQLEFCITDTGIGIAHDKVERIFEPFVQADNSVTRQFGGTGLGLAISRRIARGLGGNLTATSVVGCGSRFILTIDTGDVRGVPLIVPDVCNNVSDKRETIVQEELEATRNLEGVRVLLVEDGETNRKLLKVLLERAGAQVVTAENGEIGYSKGMAEPFDLILMDMQMPVLDGYSATRKLRDADVKLPIIALTAHAMAGDRERCLEAGCNDYLTKPVNPEQLFAILSKHLPHGQKRTVAPVVSANPPPPSPVKPFARDVQDWHPQKSEPGIASTLPADDAEFAEIIVEFIERLGQQVDEMEKVFEHGDLDAIAKLAHWLKGSGGTAGFGDFTRPASRLEKLAKEGNSVEIPDVLADLRDLFDRLIVPSLA